MQFEVPKNVDTGIIEKEISKKYQDAKFEWIDDNERRILSVESNAVREELKKIIDSLVKSQEVNEQPPSKKMDFNHFFGSFAEGIIAEASARIEEIASKSEGIVLQAKKDLEDEGVEQIAKVESIGESLREEFSTLAQAVSEANRKIDLIAEAIKKIGSCASALENEYEG